MPYADIVTFTTHKTLRGPRGGMILSNDEAIAKKDDLGDRRDRRLVLDLQGARGLQHLAHQAGALGAHRDLLAR